jgi:AcrR family transcriptional regulator
MATPTTDRRYGGKTTAERQAERREKLLDTGVELFGTRGFRNTSIELLCASAGLNARYFYEAFDTREGLLRAIYERHAAAVFAAVSEAVAAAPRTPREQLVAGLSAFVHTSLADPRAARVNFLEIVGVSAELEQCRRQVMRRYTDLATAQLGQTLGPRASIAGGDVHLAAVALVSAADGLIIDLLSEIGGDAPPTAALDRIVATLTELIVAAIGI